MPKKRLQCGLALLLTAAAIAIPAAYFSDGLSRGEITEYGGFSTWNRSIGFLRSGDWLTISANHEPVLTKPPLHYMLTAALLAQGFDTSFSLRFWPLAFAIGIVAMTALLAWILAPDEFWGMPSAALIITGSPLLWYNSRIALLDTGNAFFTVVSICAVLLAQRNARWWIAAGAFAGLGFLHKNPVPLAAAMLLIWALNRGTPPGAYRWSSLKRDLHFRIAVWIAAALCLVWPLIQFVRHGPWFLVIFIGEQWLQRFAPVNPVDPASTFDPLRFVRWLFDDAPVAWPACLLSVAVALIAPAFRQQVRLRALCSIVVIFCAVVAVAGGSLYPRYLIVMMPMLAAIGAVVLTRLLKRGWVAVMICGVLLGFRVPAVAGVRPLIYEKDHSEKQLVCERFRARLRDDETPVFIQPPNSFLFNRDAFSIYADVDRTVLTVGYNRWNQFEPLAKRSGMAPPFSGVVHTMHFDETNKRLGPLLVLERVGPYVIWRQTEPRWPRDLPAEH